MIRFLVDANLKRGIVAGCLRREPTMNFLSANEANLTGVPDPEVLALESYSRHTRSPDHAAALGRLPSDSRFQPRRAIRAAILAHRRGNRRACDDLGRFGAGRVGEPDRENSTTLKEPTQWAAGTVSGFFNSPAPSEGRH